MKDRVVYVDRVVGRFWVVKGDARWIREGAILVDSSGGRYRVKGVQQEKKGAKLHVENYSPLTANPAVDTTDDLGAVLRMYEERRMVLRQGAGLREEKHGTDDDFSCDGFLYHKEKEGWPCEPPVAAIEED